MPPIKLKERARAKKGTLKRLLKILFKYHKVPLIINLICLIFNVFANLCSSIFVNFITVVLSSSIREGGLNGANPFVGSYKATAMGITVYTNITQLLIIMGTIYAIGVFAAWWWARSMAIITHKLLNRIRIEMFDHMQDLPIKYFDTHAHGQIMSTFTNDTDTIRQFISQALPTFIQSGLMVILVLLAMMMNSIYLTLVVLVFAGLMTANTILVGGASGRYFVKQQTALGIVEGDIEESISGLKVIKVFSHEEKSLEDFKVKNDALNNASTQANIKGNIMMPINGNLGNLMYVSVAVVSVVMLISAIVNPGSVNNLSLSGVTKIESSDDISTFYGIIVSFLMLARMFTNNVSQFSQQVTFMVMGMAGASRCFDLLDEQVEADNGYVTLVNVIKNEDGTLVETNERTRNFAWKHPHSATGEVTYTELKGDIVFDDVDFGYVPNHIVLHDISIYAKPGQKIAFVGATGAGKTTITNLINRFYDIADGKIRYDGININKIKKDDLRRSLGIVLQDVNLFSGTIMDNIRYGRLDATDEEVMEAAKIANAYDFITRMPEGFNTYISGNGANLSQGQRQLISIARAAVAETPVMILDEATSSIDTRTEKLVQAGTDKLMEGRTVFVIAHRLSTVQNSNAIMVLDHGRIIERGTHEQLIALKGTYYQLYTGAFELE